MVEHNRAVVVAIKAAGGKTLAAFRSSWEASPHGVSFTAPYTGAYTIAASCGDDNCLTPVSYSLSAGRDCPGARTTLCGIGVGQTLRNLQARFWEDDDWFRTSLRAGQVYHLNVTLNGSDQTALLGVRNASGRLLASDGAAAAPATSSSRRRPPAAISSRSGPTTTSRSRPTHSR